MDSGTTAIRRQNWLQIINECNSRSSGTKKDWCQDNGIDIRQFYYWQRHLRQVMADQFLAADSKTDSISEETHQLPATPSFAEITPLPDQKEASSTELLKNPVIPEIVLEINDCRILLSSSASEQTLVKVIRSIRNA